MNPEARPAAVPNAWSPRRLAWVGGVLIAAVVALAAYDVWRARGVALAQAERELDAQARVMAEQTALSLQAVDTVLRHLAEQHRLGLLQRMSPEALHAYLQEQSVGLVQVNGIAVFGADGHAFGSSIVPPAQVRQIDLNRVGPYARFLNERGERTVVGSTRRAMRDGTWVFPIGRRLEGAGGLFTGVVGATGRVDYFQDFYRDAYPGGDTRIALLHSNGTLMAHHPPAGDALGRPLPASAAWAAPAASGPGVSRGTDPLGDPDQLSAVRAVPDQPLRVAVSRDAAAVLAPWRRQAIGTALRTLALGTLAAFLMGLTMRHLARLKATRDSLAVSEQRYALALAGSDEGHWLWDIPAGQIYVSTRLAEILGLDGGARSLRHTEYFDRLPLHPDDREPLQAARQAHLDGRTERLDHEFRIVRPETGEVRWLQTRGQCFRDAEGRPLQMAGATVDVTERKRTEEALRRSEQRFADAVAGSDDGIWEWDFTTGMAFGSEPGRRMLGLPPGGPESQPIETFAAEVRGRLHPDDRARRQAAVDDHLAGRTPAYSGDFRFLQPDGSWRWVHIHGRAVRDADGRVLRVAGSVRDIDDRKRAEDALRQSEERYALAMAGSSGGYWVWNTASDELFVSEKIHALMGQPADGPQLTTRAAFFSGVTLHPDDRELFRTVSADLRSGRRERAVYEYRILLPDAGGERWILSRAQRFEGQDGGDLRVAGVTVDITERKRAELERHRLEDQLRQAQKLESIGTLAGGIAHDFNNILSAILGYGELAQRCAAEGTPLRRHIDASVAAGQRAKALVERILAFSRSGMGERVPVHVQAVVDEALDAVAGALPPGIALARTLQAEDAGVLGDPTQIHQVVMNLCTNAVQAMGAEGRLEVTLQREHLGTPLSVATSTLPSGAYLRLTVADTGRGIAPALKTRIFDPFFTTKEVGVGTGLGLSLVHGIVVDLGGGIAVESEVGHGSRFDVWLPAQAGGVRPTPAERGEAERGDGQVVLLVDDEEALVHLGEEALAEIGYEPVGFTSPVEALQALRDDPQRFDLLLTDESMPGMTGTELARAARALRPGLPVVLASGYVTPALVAQAHEAGVAEVLSKPLAIDGVARALAAALRRLNPTEN